MQRPSKKQVIAAVVAVQTVSAAFAYRDLAKRPDETVRGTKRMWRIIMALNTGNSLAYWLFGRRSV